MSALFLSSQISPAIAQSAARAAEPISYGNALSVVTGLAMVVALLFALAWLMRRNKGVLGNGSQKIAVISQLPVGVREKVLLLRVGEENVLVGYSGGGLQALHAWHGDIPADIEVTDQPPQNFADYLSRLRANRSDK
ncbi:flagellar protein FliO/FliZ [Litorivivens lipolytica]|uniref:Flagellar protein FliO/FliZ n=1 Tax=Litorivivens lipolytica TaxID=1524264 RepID=A0A7W4W2Q8_9GAMM|nr:flagellar biosynthetic protein FliO [Litorivivens lipolytica]MBB3046358.1 flagellar protein FliO/FliZ [Litorivivens lipolytica]